MKIHSEMLQIKQFTKLPIETSLDRLLFILALLGILLLSPYFIWSSQLLIYRAVYFAGILMCIYIFFTYHDSTLYNTSLVVFFFILSFYTMVVGTQNHYLTYIPFLALSYITLKPAEHLRTYEYFITILAIVYIIGLLSYFLQIIGLNFQIGTATALNPSKSPYIVYFGHVVESDLTVYRFCSIFDEAGVVGTLNGLILSATGISKQNIKSIIILIAGLISFSLAFYIILSLILIKNLNFKYIILILFFVIGVRFATGDLFDNLILNRVRYGTNDNLAVGDRTGKEFDEYFKIFVSHGGSSLIFGKGSGSYRKEAEEGMFPSSYKTLIIDNGLVGIGLILCFYAFSVYYFNNSKEGWFLGFIFIISAYQRPDLLSFYIIIMFLGGLNLLKYNYSISRNKPSVRKTQYNKLPRKFISLKNAN